MSARNNRIINFEHELIPIASSGAELAVDAVTPVGLPALSDADEYMVLQVQGGNVRVRYDGTNPTASVGRRILDGESVTLNRGKVAVAKILSESGSVTIYHEKYTRG